MHYLTMPALRAPLVELTDIVVQFNENLVFDRFSLTVCAGRHLALTGPNGSGKSTLLRLMAADLRLSQITPGGRRSTGLIHWFFDGEKEASALVAKEHVRLVSPTLQGEYFRQEWRVTAEEVILLGLGNTALLYSQPDEAERRKAHALAREASLLHLLPMEIPALSQGQLRAVLIMRAIMAQPALLLLDEPFEGLDQAARHDLAFLMGQAAERGSTLIITAHRTEDIPNCVTEYIYLAEKSGKALTVGASADSLEESFPVTEEPPVAAIMPEQILALHRQHVEELIPSQKPLLALENVDVYIERSQVLFNLDWQVNKGENWLLSGKNGAGKSTLLRLIYGEEFAAFGGDIHWFGRERMTLEEIHTTVGFVSDRLHQTYTYDITARQVVASGFDGSVGLYRDCTPREEATMDFWLERLHILPFASTPFRSLSTGQGRRVLLARALVNAPPLLLLDEALSGLDPENRALWRGMLPLLAESGTQVVLVTHHQDDVPAFFTHELALENGRIKRNGPR